MAVGNVASKAITSTNVLEMISACALAALMGCFSFQIFHVKHESLLVCLFSV